MSSLCPSRWDKTYWLARILINSDRYGAIGSRANTLRLLASNLRQVLDLPLESQAKLLELRSVLQNTMVESLGTYSAKRRQAIEQLFQVLGEELQSVKDYEVH